MKNGSRDPSLTSLMGVLIVVAVVLFIAAITIPNLMRISNNANSNAIFGASLPRVSSDCPKFREKSDPVLTKLKQNVGGNDAIAAAAAKATLKKIELLSPLVDAVCPCPRN